MSLFFNQLLSSVHTAGLRISCQFLWFLMLLFAHQLNISHYETLYSNMAIPTAPRCGCKRVALPPNLEIAVVVVAVINSIPSTLGLLCRGSMVCRATSADSTMK